MSVNFMPGDSKQLQKAEIAATEGPKTKVTVYFNPKEIAIDKKVPWQQHKNSEGDSPTLEFTAGQGKTLTCELMFDMFEDKGDVYATYISKLEKLALIDGGLKRPPLCTFTWGSNMPVFKGVVEDLNVKYTLFLPDGTPCRATASLSMKQSDHLLNKAQAEKAAKDEEEAKRKGAKVAPGERADSAAEKTGHGAGNTRQCMSDNNVDNPQALSGGNMRGPKK